MKKYYQIVTVNTRTNEEWLDWEGADFEEAIVQKQKATSDFDHYLTEREKKERIIECRLYNFPDDVDFDDKDSIVNAICDATGFDEF